MFEEEVYSLMGDVDSLYDQYDLETDKIVITDNMLNGIADEDEYDKLLSANGISLNIVDDDLDGRSLPFIEDIGAVEAKNIPSVTKQESLQEHVDTLMAQLKDSQVFPSYLTSLWIAALESADYRNTEQALTIVDEVYQQFNNVCSCFATQSDEYTFNSTDTSLLKAERNNVKNECSWVSYLLKSQQTIDGKSVLDKVVAF